MTETTDPPPLHSLPPLPAGCLRLFPNHDPDALRAYPAFVIGRLLEEGDARDLRWLFGAVPSATVDAWMGAHGRHRLSGRSLAFWCHLFGHGPDADAVERPALARDIWPL